jgi:predicted PurR-regulated permease PerM
LNRNYSDIVLLVSLTVAVLVCFLLVRPYIEPILIAVLLGLIFHPFHVWLGTKLGQRPNTTALATCFLLTIVILIPAVLVGLAILRQGVIYSSNIYLWASGGGLENMIASPWVTNIVDLFKAWVPQDLFGPETIKKEVLKIAAILGQDVVGASARLAAGITGFLVSLLLMLFVLFFVLRDYERMVAFLHHAVPLSRSQENLLIEEIRGVSKSSLLGTFLTGVCQGIAGGFALWLAGFPGLFWGTMMAFASLIPVVGTALIWFPAAVYLVVTGSWGWGLFLVLWGVLVVGSIDNFLRPLLMHGSSSMHTVIIFFSLLGGIAAFGLMGLLYGPIVFTITLVLYHLYEQEFRDFLDIQDRN